MPSFPRFRNNLARVAIALSLLLFSYSSHSEFNQDQISIQQRIDIALNNRTATRELFAKDINYLLSVKNIANTSQKLSIEYLEGFYKYLYVDAQHAISIYERLVGQSINLEVKMYAITSLSNIYLLRGDFGTALELATMLESQEFQHVSAEKRFRSLLHLVYLFLRSGLYQQAEEVFKSLPDIELNIQERCLFYGQEISLEYRLGRLSDQADVYSEERKYCHDNKEKISALLMDNFVARNLLELDSYQEGLSLLLRNKQDVLGSGYINLITQTYALLTKAYLAIGNYPAALEEGLKAAESANSSSSSESKAIAFKAIADAYFFSGEYERMRHYLQQYHDAYEDMVSKQRSAAIALNVVRLRNAQQEFHIQELDRQITRMELEQKLIDTRTENHTLLLILLTALVLLGAAWINRARRARYTLTHQAQYDELTGVFNRRHATILMESSLENELALSQEVGFILLDLDKFKQINDRFGHQAGDWALCRTADVLMRMARQGDIIGRFGGEEFGLLLPGCDLDGTRQLAEKIRTALSAVDTRRFTDADGNGFRLTGSFGVTTASLCGYQLNRLMSEADRAMYQAKDQGRDRVVLSQPVERSQRA